MANSKCFIFSADNTWEDACEKVQNGEITRIDFKGVLFDKVKHGHWEKKGGWYWCSVCGDHWGEGGANYCPNCGAEMEGTPIVDAIEVVRCKECRFFRKYGFNLEHAECIRFDYDATEDGYCCWAERRE